jgi:hypothetical protein
MIHVLPVNDSEEHILDSTCSCNPQIENAENGHLLVIHNSFDGRELIEELLDGPINEDNNWEVIEI